jgi:hypothetical protein
VDYDNRFMLGSSVLLVYSWVYAQTHVYNISIYKGFQWALFVASVVKGPLRPLGNMQSMCKGV